MNCATASPAVTDVTTSRPRRTVTLSLVISFALVLGTASAAELPPTAIERAILQRETTVRVRAEHIGAIGRIGFDRLTVTAGSKSIRGLRIRLPEWPARYIDDDELPQLREALAEIARVSGDDETYVVRTRDGVAIGRFGASFGLQFGEVMIALKPADIDAIREAFK